MTTIATIAGLKSHPYTSGDEVVLVQGNINATDGGGGLFSWDSQITGDFDDLTVVQYGTTLPGGWKRISNGSYNVKWFGAKGDTTIIKGAGSISAGSNQLTVAGASFTSQDKDKIITINGAASPVNILEANGYTLAPTPPGNNSTLIPTSTVSISIPVALSAKIDYVISSTEIILNVNAQTSVSGADVSYGTNDQGSIQSAIDKISTIGGGRLYFPPGIYSVTASPSTPSAALIMKSRVDIYGDSKFSSIIYAMADGFILIDRAFPDTSVTILKDKSFTIKNICLWGFADRFTYQNPPGLPACYLMRLGNYEFIEVDNVYGKWSREMGFSLRGDNVSVTNSNMEHILRDGINAGEAKRVVFFNIRGKYIEDDFLAANASGVVGGTDTNLPVVGNTIIITYCQGYSCQGISLSCARTTIISNNILTNIKSRAIRASVESADAQIETMNLIITNNIIKDVFKQVTMELGYGTGSNLNKYPDTGSSLRYSLTASANGITVSGPQMNTGGTTVQVPPGTYYRDTATPANSKFIRPEPYWNFSNYNDKNARPHGQSRGIIIADNIIMQTTGGLTKLSDGYRDDGDTGAGGFWMRRGFIDVNGYKGNIVLANGTDQLQPTTIDDQSHAYWYRSYGIQYGGPVKGLKISNNYIYGYQVGMFIDTSTNREDVKIYGNTLERLVNGINFNLSGSTLYQTDIDIHNNTFDIDPYLEALDRTATDGTWINPTIGNYCAIGNYLSRGIKCTQNIFKNCKSPLSTTALTNAITLFKNNFMHGDPAGLKGVGKFINPLDNEVIYTDSDPSSATFGNILSSFQTEATTQPTSGAWIKGQMVKNSNIAVDVNNKVLIGWRRLTTGTTNVASDWSPVYESTVTP